MGMGVIWMGQWAEAHCLEGWGGGRARAALTVLGGRYYSTNVLSGGGVIRGSPRRYKRHEECEGNRLREV